MPNDTVRRDARERNIAVRLASCSEDELRVVDFVLARLEIGRERYGLLDLKRRAGHDWQLERAEELADAVVYTAFEEIVQQDKRIEEIERDFTPVVEVA